MNYSEADGIPSLHIDGGRTGPEIAPQQTATMVAKVDKTLRTQRSQNIGLHDGDDLIGNYHEGASLSVDDDDLVFVKSPQSSSLETGVRKSPFSVWDGVVMNKSTFYMDYDFLGSAMSQYNPDDTLSTQGLTVCTRGSVMYKHAGDKVLTPGQRLIWDVKRTSDAQVRLGQTTMHAPPLKRARLASEMPVRAYLKPMTKTDVTDFMTVAVRRALDKGKENNPFDLPLLHLDPVESEALCADPNTSCKLDEHDDAVLTSVKLPISVIALSTLVTFAQHGLITFTERTEPTPLTPFNEHVAHLSRLLDIFDMSGKQITSKDSRDLMGDILAKLYWDYGSNQNRGMWNDPSVWCRDEGPSKRQPARTLLNSHKVLTTDGYVDQFITFQKRCTHEAAGVIYPGDKNLIVR